MKQHVIVREYARLTTEPGAKDSLESAHISSTAFDWLCRMRGKWGKDERAFVHLSGYKTLRLDSYVGVLESPCGTRIEILPKIHNCGQSVEDGRRILLRMLQVVLRLPSRETDKTHIKTLSRPLNEWVMYQFLQALLHLLKQGLDEDWLAETASRNDPSASLLEAEKLLRGRAPASNSEASDNYTAVFLARAPCATGK